MWDGTWDSGAAMQEAGYDRLCFSLLVLDLLYGFVSVSTRADLPCKFPFRGGCELCNARGDGASLDPTPDIAESNVIG